MLTTKFKLLAAGAAVACLAFGAALAQGWSTPQPMAQGVLASAAAYARYMEDAASIRAEFASGGDVAEALKRGAAHQPQQLQEGMVAYAALIALRDDGFVNGVHEAARRYGAGYTSTLLANPAMATRISGAERVGERIDETMAAQGEALLVAGKTVKQSAYDVQLQAWSKARIKDPAGRLARVKAMSATPAAYDPAEGQRLFAHTASSRWGGSAHPPSLLAMKGMTLAALAVLGKAGDTDAASLKPVLADASSASCVRMAKLNLYQCLAVAGPHFEDVFCLGQHAIMDTGQCVMKASGAKPRADGYRQAGLIGGH